nr:probable fructokinase-5 [Tanacetum cinerariifolium]
MAASSSIVCFGEMLIDFVPNESGVSLAEAQGFIKAPGGAPANVACAVSKLGGSAAFVGKVGKDEFGYMLADILKQNGVNADGLLFDEHARTALAFVTLKNDGEREFMFYRNPSADMLLKESELKMDLITKAKIFHYGSISLITEPCRSAHMAAMKAAKQAGVLLSYDPNVRLPLWPSAEAAREGINSIWKEADFIKVSDDEVEFLTQKKSDDEEAVMSLWHDGLKLLVVTDGEKGCRYYTKNFKGKVSGYSVKAIDTTGAGDSFVGSLLVSMAKDSSIFTDEAKLKQALAFSNACGAICTTKKGAIPALPSVSDAETLIASKTRFKINFQFPKKLIQNQADDLERMVSRDEIRLVVWNCGDNKSPGPDGYSFEFLKKYWDLIGSDLFEAVEYFFRNDSFPKGCNSSFIALIPKVLDAKFVSDFRPISLIGCVYKVITKVLANRLMEVISDLVSDTQSAFVSGKQILDGPFILDELLQWCKRRDKQTMFFKVDFAKAYDSIRWDYLIDVLGSFGFGPVWCNWIRRSLTSAKASILIMKAIRSRFFNGIGQEDSKITWIAWNKALASKKRGGQGVSSFFALNQALLLKWVWRFISQDGSLLSRVMTKFATECYPFKVTQTL